MAGTTSKKAKAKQADDDAEDQKDQGDDEDQEQEDDGNKTDAQKREDAFREMVARKRGKK